MEKVKQIKYQGELDLEGEKILCYIFSKEGMEKAIAFKAQNPQLILDLVEQDFFCDAYERIEVEK